MGSSTTNYRKHLVFRFVTYLKKIDTGCWGLHRWPFQFGARFRYLGGWWMMGEGFRKLLNLFKRTWIIWTNHQLLRVKMLVFRKISHHYDLFVCLVGGKHGRSFTTPGVVDRAFNWVWFLRGTATSVQKKHCMEEKQARVCWIPSKGAFWTWFSFPRWDKFNFPSQKEIHLLTMDFQGPFAVSFREGTWYQLYPAYLCLLHLSKKWLSSCQLSTRKSNLRVIETFGDLSFA